MFIKLLEARGVFAPRISERGGFWLACGWRTLTLVQNERQIRAAETRASLDRRRGIVANRAQIANDCNSRKASSRFSTQVWTINKTIGGCVARFLCVCALTIGCRPAAFSAAQVFAHFAARGDEIQWPKNYGEDAHVRY